MRTTTLYNMLDPEEGLTYRELTRFLQDLLKDPAFGRPLGVSSTLIEGVVERDYELTKAQIICLVTGLRDGSLVYLVREIMYLEEKNEIVLTEQVTDTEINKMVPRELSKAYNDIDKTLMAVSASMDMVTRTLDACKLFCDLPSQRGTVSLSRFTDLLTEATDEPLTSTVVTALLIRHSSVSSIGTNFTAHRGRYIIHLSWVATILDDVMKDIFAKNYQFSTSDIKRAQSYVPRWEQHA